MIRLRRPLGRLATCAALLGVAVAPARAQVAPNQVDVPALSVADEMVVPQPQWRLDIEAPKALRNLLRTYLDLARFQSEPQAGSDQINLVELRRLVVSAPEQARGLIEAEGYFSANITTRVTDATDSQPMVVLLKIEPGPRTVIKKVQIIFEGELDEQLAADNEQAKALVQSLRRYAQRIRSGWCNLRF